MTSEGKRGLASVLEQAIQDAFAGVELEDGVGLLEGEEIDRYGGPERRARVRATDEKTDWSRIPIDHLNGAAQSLSYFDAKGMRLHLPAFLIADLRGLLTQDVRYRLVSRGHDDRFALFSPSQRQAVRAYLELQLQQLPEPNLQFEGPAIQAAIDGFWADENPATTT